MWAASIEDDSEPRSLGGNEAVDQDGVEERSTRSILAGSDVPFSHLFPDSLQHLRILDDVGTEEVASHIDRRMRDLVLDPRFSELHDVQIRRNTAFTEHVRDIGCHIERRSFWNIMRRMQFYTKSCSMDELSDCFDTLSLVFNRIVAIVLNYRTYHGRRCKRT